MTSLALRRVLSRPVTTISSRSLAFSHSGQNSRGIAAVQTAHTSSPASSVGSMRSFSSSPLDKLFDPDAPCPIYGTPKSQPILKHKRNKLECGLYEDQLRFRTCHYGATISPPYIHANEHKVQVLIDTDILPLDELGTQILRQTVGHQRFNVERKLFKMQCNYFPSRIENKRYLVHMLDKLLLSCQRLSKSAVEGTLQEKPLPPNINDEDYVEMGTVEKKLGGFRKTRPTGYYHMDYSSPVDVFQKNGIRPRVED